MVKTAPGCFRKRASLSSQSNSSGKSAVNGLRRDHVCALVNIAHGNITAGVRTQSNQRETGKVEDLMQQIKNVAWEQT